MDSEKLARMVRIAIGEHNDESEPVVALAKKMADEIARLRAEADALVEALERVLPQYIALMDDCGLSSNDTVEEARAAIAKARGEGNEQI